MVPTDLSKATVNYVQFDQLSLQQVADRSIVEDRVRHYGVRNERTQRYKISLPVALRAVLRGAGKTVYETTEDEPLGSAHAMG
jgi:hypothetical protein